MTGQPHTCPDSGGAHHFHPDAEGVPVCSCGAVEIAPDIELALTEIAGGPFPGDVMRPREHRQRLNERLSGILRDQAGIELDAAQLTDEHEQQWRAAGGGVPEDTDT